jgi:hypothetical protein
MSNSFLRPSLRAAIAGWILIALVASPRLAAPAELRGTKQFADVAETVERFANKYGAEHVLLALDIDNTVMSMDQDLGSDHWFEWQRYLLENEPESRFLVGKTFEDLLKVQGILYNRTPMHPPEAQQPAIIARLQKLGIATILLTSRGPEFREATQRELDRCQYKIAATALPVRGVPEGAYLAYDPVRPEQDGLTAAEIVTFKLPPPRPVSYANGLFMTAGQHKGIMLLTLLKDSMRDIKAVIYVDDNVRHVGNVFSSTVDRGIDIASFHYQHEDTRVQRFNYGDKQHVHARWKAIERELAGRKIVRSSTISPCKAAMPCSRRRVRCP